MFMPVAWPGVAGHEDRDGDAADHAGANMDSGSGVLPSASAADADDADAMQVDA